MVAEGFSILIELTIRQRPLGRFSNNTMPRSLRVKLTNCPDCGEAVEIPPPSADNDELEITCQTCGLAAPAREWWEYAPEDDNSLLGISLANATIAESVPKRWALRTEQLTEIREVVVELQYQIRLLRQALDELNQDLPDRVKRWFGAWHQEYFPVEELVNAIVASLPVSAAPPPSAGKPRAGKAPRNGPSTAKNQAGLW